MPSSPEMIHQLFIVPTWTGLQAKTTIIWATIFHLFLGMSRLLHFFGREVLRMSHGKALWIFWQIMWKGATVWQRGKCNHRFISGPAQQTYWSVIQGCSFTPEVSWKPTQFLLSVPLYFLTILCLWSQGACVDTPDSLCWTNNSHGPFLLVLFCHRFHKM